MTRLIRTGASLEPRPDNVSAVSFDTSAPTNAHDVIVSTMRADVRLAKIVERLGPPRSAVETGAPRLIR
ncbi:hypothetical protein [Diaminobutyricibacter sp. McL0608]|uniref:hypothetical protein n=1 Tax=Leifsonia sp. McL0608 TaxID=3143537 RepID=UPI0031F2FCE0